MNKEQQKLQFEALKLMPETFTSDLFAHTCRDLGVDNKFIECGGNARFLHRQCRQQLGAQRTWHKIKPHENIEETKLSEAIKIVIAAGYKVLKPKTEWVEM